MCSEGGRTLPLLSLTREAQIKELAHLLENKLMDECDECFLPDKPSYASERSKKDELEAEVAKVRAARRQRHLFCVSG